MSTSNDGPALFQVSSRGRRPQSRGQHHTRRGRGLSGNVRYLMAAMPDTWPPRQPLRRAARGGPSVPAGLVATQPSPYGPLGGCAGIPGG
jgi:hypothetical protein